MDKFRLCLAEDKQTQKIYNSEMIKGYTPIGLHRLPWNTGTGRCIEEYKQIQHNNSRVIYKRSNGPNWERLFSVFAMCKITKRKKRQRNLNTKGLDPWVGMRTGGGQPKHITIRNDERRKNDVDFKPVALSQWADWNGGNATTIQDRIAERLTGGMVADSSRKVYAGLFNQWRVRRRVLGKTEFLSPRVGDKDENETSAIAYFTLNLGPVERDVGTVQNHLQAIGYFHRVRFGNNPLREMARLQNIMKGARREKGPCKRKLPVTAGDLNCIYQKTNWDCPDSVTVWCAISLAWFFMLRMGGYLEKAPKEQKAQEYLRRHPLQMNEIEPLVNGKKADWSQDVGEISIYISGSKTDWINHGMVRSHNQIPVGTTNDHLRPVKGLKRLWEINPAKFQRSNGRIYASWKSDRPIKPDRILAMLSMALFEQGMNPSAFSLHSLRAGGATPLYRATGNIELVARMGRWRTSSISAYLWESHEIMRGLGKLMAQGGHTLHNATKNMITLRPGI